MKRSNEGLLYSTVEARRILGCRTNAEFFMRLVHEGVLSRIRDRYVVTSQYAGMDLTRSFFNYGKWSIFWTEIGFEFLFDLRNGQTRMDYQRQRKDKQ